jgi:hypothetical protein
MKTETGGEKSYQTFKKEHFSELKNKISQIAEPSSSQSLDKKTPTARCNPSYSGDRDQKDHSSKPAQANSL